jgi:hypothetical protein
MSITISTQDLPSGVIPVQGDDGSLIEFCEHQRIFFAVMGRMD